MRQIWITRAGPPEVLQVKEAPDPEPTAGEVRIRVEASGINFADILGRLGLYPDLPPLPVVPGYEVGGRVDAVGEGVAADWIGRDVIASTRFGGYADTVCVPVAQVFARPAGMSALEGAAIPVNYFTAWQLIVVMGSLKRNETVLIHSVGGGVGIAGHLEITDDVHLTGMTFVTKSITEPGVYSSGMPAETNRQWHRSIARYRKLDELAARIKALEEGVKTSKD